MLGVGVTSVEHFAETLNCLVKVISIKAKCKTHTFVGKKVGVCLSLRWLKEAHTILLCLCGHRQNIGDEPGGTVPGKLDIFFSTLLYFYLEKESSNTFFDVWYTNISCLFCCFAWDCTHMENCLFSHTSGKQSGAFQTMLQTTQIEF